MYTLTSGFRDRPNEQRYGNNRLLRYWLISENFGGKVLEIYYLKSRPKGHQKCSSFVYMMITLITHDSKELSIECVPN